MHKFTPEEIAYLQSQYLGRLATVSEKGELHVVPVTFRYNPEQEIIDIGGHNIKMKPLFGTLQNSWMAPLFGTWSTSGLRETRSKKLNSMLGSSQEGLSE